jgi:hypothetical protein
MFIDTKNTKVLVSIINLMFVVPYILVTNVFILVELNVQFFMFLKSLLAQHVQICLKHVELINFSRT